MSDQEEFEVEAIGVEVNVQPIELYKVLKIANVVSGGGEAKHVIGEGYVGVNGELEQRKRRKMYDGDVIEFNDEYYVVICDTPVGELPEVKEKPQFIPVEPEYTEPKPKKEKKEKKKKQKPETPTTVDPESGRRSINFF
ncbi:RNA-binding S4 domain-containing protein [Aliivibrio sp. S4TY2]|uniref:RNA-binding S4 domain-containing protein n=1 Tax=unclassified Aliivibrio TaxID=2645654 RepID=UPI002378108E|nr:MULTISPECIES: RNA-binding S4 domain-containing protein [unclassified Aliivibrio]MDD9156844.1 RNA-binding S4 domain-containing protein [Aliivibrio sp. S4TY2]MDD9160330.1 RNA-binding S4 domain-containing protein [Aliivibrio sp. S4TY1]MDD9164377.1 RNA-binding S4 domain-containing protein [Aliivibrio sp. S4MY2]MDD9168753.1 RNA-binding S4 domain-containing protein [Aliivibrio sp. S4MY4]MDD9184712.1 RNA-binding S4 domain-containing protein [Aliivibrio sp. S4MY3]